jgi:hypothetical protein
MAACQTHKKTNREVVEIKSKSYLYKNTFVRITVFCLLSGLFHIDRILCSGNIFRTVVGESVHISRRVDLGSTKSLAELFLTFEVMSSNCFE